MDIATILQGNTTYLSSEGFQELSPEISIIMLASEDVDCEGLQKTIDTLLNQKIPNIELILIDDTGGGKTSSYLRSLVERGSGVACYFHELPVGLSALCLNEGILSARGRYLAFLSEGVTLSKGMAEQTIAFMESESVVASYGICEQKATGKVDACCFGDPETHIDTLFYRNFISLFGVMLRSEVFTEIGLFDPNPLLQDNFDWDFWLRLTRRHYFAATGFPLSTIKSQDQRLKSASGGQDEPWSFWECSRIKRNPSLLREAYGRHDVFETYGERTNLFLQAMRSASGQFSDKYWFDPGDRKYKELAVAGRPATKVLLSCPGVESSVSLCFNHVFWDSEYILRYQFILNVTADDIEEADILIVSRHLELTKNQVRWARKLGVPCFYYVDDEFLSFAEDFPDLQYIQDIALLTTEEYLSNFVGIIVPSRMLQEFFIEHHHRNTVLCEPNFDSDNLWPHREDISDLHVAFFGGKFREDIFHSCILPALHKLSLEMPVSVFLPEDTTAIADGYIGDTVKMWKLKRLSYLDSALAMYASHGIDVQVHPTGPMNFSLYKTKNALINAVQMGAVLIVSDYPPFDSAESDTGVLVVRNDVESWYDALKKVAFDKEFRDTSYDKAFHYCHGRFDPQKSSTVLAKAFQGAMDHQAKNATYERSPRGFLPDKRPSIPPEGIRRIFDHIQGTRKYKALCTVKNLKAIGVIFSFEGDCSGEVALHLSSRKTSRKSSLRMEDIRPGTWNYFEIETIRESEQEIFDIVLEFKYDENSSLVGIWEDQRKRSLLHKIINKLGIFPRKTDLLFVDWAMEKSIG